MKLVNFEEYIEDLILERGKSYFNNGHIEKVEEIDKNHFIVEVVGSENYTVEIMTDDTEEIVGSYCNCPYDWGDYCKHQAAAFFALREKTVGIDIRTRKLPSNTGKKVDLKEIVSNLKKDELITIILDISREYHEIEKELLFKYAPAKDEISYSKKLIREYINRSKRHGFIEWRNVSEAIRGANMTLEKAHEKLAEGETETAILLSIAVLSIVVDMIQYCDDSSGYVGDVIAESIEIIHETVSLGINKMNASQQRKLFSTRLFS
jgi:uncharacterized Zn finger protein